MIGSLLSSLREIISETGASLIKYDHLQSGSSVLTAALLWAGASDIIVDRNSKRNTVYAINTFLIARGIRSLVVSYRALQMLTRETMMIVKFKSDASPARFVLIARDGDDGYQRASNEEFLVIDPTHQGTQRMAPQEVFNRIIEGDAVRVYKNSEE